MSPRRKNPRWFRCGRIEEEEEEGRRDWPVPLEAEDGGDEPDGDGLAEERGEHERHGGEEPRRGAELGVPPAVEGRARGGGQRQRPPERRLQPAVPPPPRRRQVAARVVHAHVRRGRQAQPARARRGGSPVSPWRRGPLCLGLRHGREFREGLGSSIMGFMGRTSWSRVGEMHKLFFAINSHCIIFFTRVFFTSFISNRIYVVF